MRTQFRSMIQRNDRGNLVDIEMVHGCMIRSNPTLIHVHDFVMPDSLGMSTCFTTKHSCGLIKRSRCEF